MTTASTPETATVFSRAEVARASRAFGVMLWLPPEIDGPRLLWALSGCESSFGANAKPRHEPAFDVGGEYAANPAQAKLLSMFGSAAACSYGPWQILLVNATAPGILEGRGGTITSPDDLARIERCALCAVQFINRRILNPDLGASKAQTVEEIAEAYNSGKWRWTTVPAGVQRYGDQCRKYYQQVPLPPAAV